MQSQFVSPKALFQFPCEKNGSAVGGLGHVKEYGLQELEPYWSGIARRRPTTATSSFSTSAGCIDDDDDGPSRRSTGFGPTMNSSGVANEWPQM